MTLTTLPATSMRIVTPLPTARQANGANFSRRKTFGRKVCCRYSLVWATLTKTATSLLLACAAMPLPNSIRITTPACSLHSRASWKISSEEFFEPLKNVVNLLKVRGSWGQVGNVALVPRYSWNVPLNETDWAMIYGKDLNNIVYGGVYAGSIGTKDLKWETTEQWGVGLDMGLLDNSLNLTVDYFNKRTKDLIEVVPVPSVAGISVSPYGNVGDVVNRGWEFGLSYSKKIGHVTFGVNGNLSTVHNEVLDLGNLEFMQHNVVINSLTPLRSAVGHPWYSYYVLKTEGIFQSQEEIDNFTWRDPETGIKQKVQPNAKPGDFKYVDFNNDGKITDDDKQYLGSYMPKITFGFGGNLQWKGSTSASSSKVWGNPPFTTASSRWVTPVADRVAICLPT